MKRLALVLFLVAPVAVCGQEADEVPTVRLSVRPAGPSSPALRYRLLPELRDLKPGNAAQLYYRTFAPDWLTHVKPEIAKQLDELELKPGQAPPSEFEWVETARYLKEVDRGARRAYCDWELIERVREEGAGLLLPDMQSLRPIGKLLAVRARFELQGGKHDQAHATLQTGFALARHVSEGPTLIHALVGISIGKRMLTEVEQWIERPGSPNLYWPLTNLPRPLADLRRPLEGDRLMTDHLLPGLRDTVGGDRAEVLSAEQTEKLVRTFLLNVDRLSGGTSKEPGWKARLGVATYLQRTYPGAKKSLLDRGKKAELVEKMPVAQVVLLEELYTYDRLYDELAKLHGLPLWQIRDDLAKLNKELNEVRAETIKGNRASLLAGFVFPAVDRVVFGSAHFDRQVALLRTVEALRLYAAAHDGKLPAKLDDVKEVPVPTDPVTGKPFEFKVENNKATLTAPAPPDNQRDPYRAARYEITLVK